MNVDDIISRIRRGEDSVTQFKRQAVGVAKLADEMVAFANAEGGVILFGVVNMFMHRDYFVESPWRVFIFDERIEIISPGCLPNHLTIEKMKSGVSCPERDHRLLRIEGTSLSRPRHRRQTRHRSHPRHPVREERA